MLLWNCVVVLTVVGYSVSTQALPRGSNVDFDSIKPLFEESYKYVIVGGGTAGCVVARRLSDDVKKSVLLLESGPSDDLPPIRAALEVPFGQHTNGPFAWAIHTEPQKYGAKALVNKTSLWHGGRVLGGTSSINGLLYVRGSPQNFDDWEAQGNTGWGYRHVLEYFKKSELNLDPVLQRTGYHGTSGPWTVERQDAAPDLNQKFMEAGQELGYSETDINGPDQYGFTETQHNSLYGRRMSTSTAFLKPVMGRRNLHIKTLSTVIKILIHRRKAVGVLYVDQKGAPHFIRATKEVIVSAGTVMSPKILMLSGIGPKQHLQSLGIKPIKNLPVGDNLRDHVSTDLSFTFNDTLGGYSVQDYATFQALSDYVFKGTGVWASSAGVSTAFVNPDGISQDKRPALNQLELVAGLFGNSEQSLEIAQQTWNFDETLFRQMHGAEAYRYGMVMLIFLCKCRHTGTIRLKSQDPAQDPVIDLQYLEDQRDVDEMLKGIRFVQKVMKSQAFGSVKPMLSPSVHPGCAGEVPDSDAYWECYVRHNTLQSFHYTSSCRMGQNEADSVVDEQLRVHGVRDLRVVDASVMPDVVAGNTMATVVMIAEKGADYIKGKA